MMIHLALQIVMLVLGIVTYNLEQQVLEQKMSLVLLSVEIQIGILVTVLLIVLQILALLVLQKVELMGYIKPIHVIINVVNQRVEVVTVLHRVLWTLVQHSTLPHLRDMVI
jgi:hypothetical protein